MSLLVKAGVRTFLALEDTPSSYSGQGDKGINVASGEAAVEFATRESGVAKEIDGGGSALTTGEKGYITAPWSGEIVGVELEADQAGDVVLDLWKDTYANFPPTVADTITASAKPTLSSAQKYKDTTLTGWTTTVTKGDIIAFNIDSVATITRLLVTLYINKS